MKHTDSKNCGCAGCIEANDISRSDVLKLVNAILQHGKSTRKRINVSDVERRVFSETKLPVINRPVKLKNDLYTALMDDAGVPIENRV